MVALPRYMLARSIELSADLDAIVTDDGGTDQWSFPTEQMHTAIIVARGSSAS